MFPSSSIWAGCNTIKKILLVQCCGEGFVKKTKVVKTAINENQNSLCVNFHSKPTDFTAFQLQAVGQKYTQMVTRTADPGWRCPVGCILYIMNYKWKIITYGILIDAWQFLWLLHVTMLKMFFVFKYPQDLSGVRLNKCGMEAYRITFMTGGI